MSIFAVNPTVCPSCGAVRAEEPHSSRCGWTRKAEDTEPSRYPKDFDRSQNPDTLTDADTLYPERTSP